MLEPLELSCRIQGLEQPRVTPNLDLGGHAAILGMGVAREIRRMGALRTAKPFSWHYAPVVS
jgi:hypothetical protein